ncbi:flagellar filament capping protein FliD [Noviherbaspirillum malthae]|uniref:flagellar filament capping protein FliD n=1 Tax=Noviherbaspirillum malthae TaxID=1260987 RepID=UPI00188E3CBB|nr:flagellar filament capping protein FliD [Noviherbaspirillum malthae]
MALSSTGIGSNLDVEGIVTQLMAVERKPLTTLAAKQASFQAKLTGFGTLKGAISQFQNAMRGLTDPAKFQGMKVTSADTGIASVTAAANAASSATPGSYTLEISKLAQAQKMVAAGQKSDKSPIGNVATESTLSFDFGTISGGTFDSGSGKYTGASFTSNGAGTKTIKITSTNNSLAGIRDSINAANMGVTATIVNDGGDSPYRLALTVNATGKTNSLKISVDAGGDPALTALLGHDPSKNVGQGFSETATAQNAEFKVDGISISKTTNAASDVISGVNLNLSKTGGPTTITVARDTAAATTAITSFVTSYNTLAQNLRDAGAYNASTKTAAILNGESALRSVQTQVRAILNTPIAGGDSAYTLLSQAGVSFEKDGLLTLDSAKLQKAMEKNFSGIAGMFASVGKPSDSLIAYSGTTPNTKPGAYSITIDQLARQANTTADAPTNVPVTAAITGSSAAELNINSTTDAFDIVVDGVSVRVSPLTADYTTAETGPAALAAALQKSINDAYTAAGKSPQVTVTESGGVLKVTSNLTGSASSVSISDSPGKTKLFGAAPTTTSGADVAITGSNNTLEIDLDGTKATVTLDDGNYSYADLAAAIQSKINGTAGFVAAGSSVVVSQTAGVLKITSSRYGSASSVAITGGTASTSLFGTPKTEAGLDVAGKINGVAATGSGQILTGATGNDAEGLALMINGGTTGDRGAVNFTRGYAVQFEKLAASLLSSEGPLTARTNGLDATLKNLEKEKQRITDRLEQTEKRYRAQFSALDVVIGNMSKTSAFLSQQLANLPKIE